MGKRKYNYDNLEEMRQIINNKTKGYSKLEDLQGIKNPREKVKMLCNCGNYFYPTLDSIIRQTSKSCSSCGKKRAAENQRITKEQFEKILEDKYGQEYKIVSEYKRYDEYIDVFHEKCGQIFKTKPSYMNKGRRCTICFMNHKKTTEEVKELVREATNGEYEMISEYKGIDEKVEIRHIECGSIFKRSIQCFVNEGKTGCPSCVKHSVGVELIRLFLEKHSIEYEMEKKFEECKNIRPLPFDFYLPKYNICIEYDGDHHKRVLHHWGGTEGFEKIKKRDEIKTNYCKENNIILIRLEDEATTKSKKRDYIEKTLEILILKQANTELTNKTKELLEV